METHASASGPTWLPASFEGRVAAATALALPLLFSPTMAARFWTPRAAFLLVVTAAGLPWLIADVRRGDALSRVGALLLVVAAASAIVAPQRTIAVFGLYDWGTGLLFVAGLLSLWALGRHVPVAETSKVQGALLIACGVNAVAAILQSLLDLSAYGMGAAGGRTPGLLGNPVHLSALLAGGLALAAWESRDASAKRLGVLPVLAAGLELSGGRVVVVVVAFILVGATLLGRADWRRAALVAGLVLVGFAAGAVLQRGSESGSVVGRVSSTTASSISARPLTWLSAAGAVSERPVLGWGPGSFRVASTGQRTLEIAKAEGPDKVFTDAHNILVEYGVTTGVVGVALLSGFLCLHRRELRLPLGGFAAAMLLVHLVQPQNVGTTPLAFLALGAARPLVLPSRPKGIRPASALLAVPATAAAVMLLIGDFALNQARLDFEEPDALQAARLLPRWSEPATGLATIASFRARAEHDPSYEVVIERWRREAVRRDPSDPFVWSRLGDHYLSTGQFERAASAFRHSVSLNEWSLEGSYGLAFSYDRLGRDAEAKRWYARARSLGTVRLLPGAAEAGS